MGILRDLDKDLPKRSTRFNEVLVIVRRAFPGSNVIKHSDSSNFPRFAKYTPPASAMLMVSSRLELAMPSTSDFITAYTINQTVF
jgi:hypothetical protein